MLVENSPIQTTVINACNHTISALKHILDKSIDYLSYPINCETLDNRFLTNDIRYSEEFRELFASLLDHNGPCVYWFEVTKGPSTQEIYEHFKTHKTDITRTRPTPALKSSCDESSRILYVGKVKRDFWGRLITHMGYLSGKGLTHGLQLDPWAKELGLELKLHVLPFENDMADYLGILEYALAKELKPIIGKHK